LYHIALASGYHRVSITKAITTGIKSSPLVDSQINISPMFILGCPSQNAQRPLFHFLGFSLPL
jgi:hypothetical protein